MLIVQVVKIKLFAVADGLGGDEGNGTEDRLIPRH